MYSGGDVVSVGDRCGVGRTVAVVVEEVGSAVSGVGGWVVERGGRAKRGGGVGDVEEEAEVGTPGIYRQRSHTTNAPQGTGRGR